MKKLFTLLWLIAAPLTQILAQDMLITKDADTIKCKIVRIEDDLLFFKAQEKDAISKVPIDVLHKYLFKYEWEQVGVLNQSAFENKKIDAQRELIGNVRTAGFHILRAGQYQTAAPIFGLGAVAFTVGGAVDFSKNNTANTALIATGCVLSAAAIVSQILSAKHLKKAGKEFQFVPLKESPTVSGGASKF